MVSEARYAIKRFVKARAGAAFTSRTGYYLTRYPPAPPPFELGDGPTDVGTISPADLAAGRSASTARLIEQPTFILSSVRSGSTLVRVMLNKHPLIHSPHEMHLRDVHVAVHHKYAVQSMWDIGMDQRSLQFMLWDRVLHYELTRHHKQILVNKTPTDAFMWREVQQCWPDARFVFLLRHPLAIAQSWHKVHPEWNLVRTSRHVLEFMEAVEDARSHCDGLTIRYEDITAEPEKQMRTLCEYIGVPWDPAILNYGSSSADFVSGLGDWSEKLKTGSVQPARPLPAASEVPRVLRRITRDWGYS